MNLTDPTVLAARVQEVFTTGILPIHEKLREAGRQYFPTAAEPAAASYYVPRARNTLAPADFELGGGASVEGFEQAMRELWTAQGCPELVPLAPALADLARAVRLREELSEEVSPFIYVMF